MPQSYHTEFLTATILQWQHLLKDDHCKEIITDSLEWLVNNKRCSVYAFVIMPNHLHLLWKIADGFEREEVQGALLSFTAHVFKKYLKEHNPELPEQHYVLRPGSCPHETVILNFRHYWSATNNDSLQSTH